MTPKPFLLLLLFVLAVSLVGCETASVERIQVSSSFIAAIGWSQNTLQVELRNGRIYEYYNVPYEVYASFLSAPSKGRYFNSYIKGRYRYRRVR